MCPWVWLDVGCLHVGVGLVSLVQGNMLGLLWAFSFGFALTLISVCEFWVVGLVDFYIVAWAGVASCAVVWCATEGCWVSDFVVCGLV